MTDRCETCRFWQAVPDGTGVGNQAGAWGWCRREPPRVSDWMAQMTIQPPSFGRGPSCPEESATIEAVADATIFPATYHTIWCGQFERETAR